MGWIIKSNRIIIKDKDIVEKHNIILLQKINCTFNKKTKFVSTYKKYTIST